MSYLYPVTIVRTRYGGTYEGGAWAAFYSYSNALPSGWDYDDTTTAVWWRENAWRVGIGDTPDEALEDLNAKRKRKGGRL